MRFPAMFAVLEHPEQGPILFDTGYGQAYLDERRRLTGRIYNAVTPVTTEPAWFPGARCRAAGIDPKDVRRVVLSHFHADHVAGLADFPRARFTYFASAWEAVRGLTGLRALRRGFLPRLLPANFEGRSDPIEEGRWTELPPELAPFRRAIDLLGDGSLQVLALPGHAAGQLGLLVRRTGGDPPMLLCADACWTSRSFREEIVPSAVTRLLFESARTYRATLGLLSELHRARPDIEIVPSHCEEAERRLVKP